MRTDQEDREANLFAMALLMPDELVRKEVRRMGPFDISDGTGIKLMAKKFQVSETLMALRLGQLYGPNLNFI